jgi:hypothetical protein
MTEPRIIALRRADTCVSCGVSLEAGTRAEWNPIAKSVTCLSCRKQPPAETARAAPPAPADLERGSPGASARHRYERLHDKREQQVKQRLGRRLGGLYLALSDDPQSTRAWGVGSKGERLLGSSRYTTTRA